LTLVRDTKQARGLTVSAGKIKTTSPTVTLTPPSPIVLCGAVTTAVLFRFTRTVNKFFLYSWLV